MSRSVLSPLRSLRSIAPAWCAGVLAVGFSGCSTYDATFRHFDSDRDARISQDEFKRGVQSQAFDHIDADGDESVTKEEWQIAEANYHDAPRRFSRLDRDRSGKLSRREFSSFRQKHLTLNNLFGTYDADSDGYISHDELHGASVDGR